MIPGNTTLRIEVWDSNTFIDTFIGSSEIDLEDRFFSTDFRSLKELPVEIRPLKNDASEVVMGNVKLWAEIMLKSEANRKIY